MKNDNTKDKVLNKTDINHSVLFPYLQYKLTAKLSQQGIFNLDLEYPNENTHKIGYIDDFYFNNGEFSGSLKVTERTSFDFEEGDIDIVLRPIEDLTKEINFEGQYFIPLIELFEKVDGGSYTEERVLIKNENGKFIISNSISELIYYSKEKCFVYSTLDLDGDDMQPSFKQLDLFNLLYKWNFDLDNLIETYTNVISVHDDE